MHSNGTLPLQIGQQVCTIEIRRRKERSGTSLDDDHETTFWSQQGTHLYAFARLWLHGNELDTSSTVTVLEVSRCGRTPVVAVREVRAAVGDGGSVRSNRSKQEEKQSGVQIHENNF